MGENYIRFFEAGDAMFLLESLYVHAYEDLNCMALRENGNVTVLFHNPDMSSCKADAIELLSSPRKYTDYAGQFRSYVCTAEEKFQQAVRSGDSKLFVQLFLRLLSFYRWTEFLYTDGAYELAHSHAEVAKNLADLEGLKTAGRKCLNFVTNGSQGYIWKMAEACRDESFLTRSVCELQEGTCPEIPAQRKQNHLLTAGDLLFAPDTAAYQAVSGWLRNQQQSRHTCLKGVGASSGVVSGRVWILSSNFDTCSDLNRLLESVPDGIILVSETTSPDIVSACHKAKGIVTNQGGLGSHAAIISRELGIPCVVGTDNATHLLINGDYVRLDGVSGTVTIEKKRIL